MPITAFRIPLLVLDNVFLLLFIVVVAFKCGFSCKRAAALEEFDGDALVMGLIVSRSFGLLTRDVEVDSLTAEVASEVRVGTGGSEPIEHRDSISCRVSLAMPVSGVGKSRTSFDYIPL